MNPFQRIVKANPAFLPYSWTIHAVHKLPPEVLTEIFRLATNDEQLSPEKINKKISDFAGVCKSWAKCAIRTRCQFFMNKLIPELDSDSDMIIHRYIYKMHPNFDDMTLSPTPTESEFQGMYESVCFNMMLINKKIEYIRSNLLTVTDDKAKRTDILRPLNHTLQCLKWKVENIKRASPATLGLQSLNLVLPENSYPPVSKFEAMPAYRPIQCTREGF